jgi:AraC-like DNA-binding protein
VEVAQSLQLSPMEQLRRVGINPSWLNEPDSLIPVSLICQLLENSAKDAGVENFGLRLAEQKEFSNLGPVALVLRAQPTLRRALEALCKYSHLQAEAVTLLYEERDGELVIRQELLTNPALPARQATELSLGVLYRVLQKLLRKDWRPNTVCFRHSGPKDLRVHRRVFDTHMQFNSDIDGIICSGDELDEPLPGYEAEIARYIQRLIDTIDLTPRASTSEKVRQLVLLLMPSGRCSIKVVAQHLGLDLRTLQRHLVKDGASFSEILDNIRIEQGTKYLIQHDRPIRELADLLGFSEPSAFSRWFSSRFGCSPSVWRRQQISPASPIASSLDPERREIREQLPNKSGLVSQTAMWR